jgi:hypothetical protein
VGEETLEVLLVLVVKPEADVGPEVEVELELELALEVAVELDVALLVPEESASPYPILHDPEAMLMTGLDPRADIDVGTPERERMVDPAGRIIVELKEDIVKLSVHAPPFILVNVFVS